MPKTSLRKEKWTLSFDSRLKRRLVQEAKRKGVYPVSLLEEIVRDRFNPYGHTDVKDSVAYVRELRKGSRSLSDEDFLEEIREWQRSSS
jgi:hypothetical protein